MTRHRFLACMTALVLTACTSAPTVADGATFVVVRHAEKADASRDPDLNDAGVARAQALAARFRDDPPVALYTTDLRRTRQTLAPVAAAHGLVPVLYDGAAPTDAFAARLKETHHHGTVLIAGHSNTVPALVSALCACPAAPMTDAEFDRLSTVHVDATGRATLVVTRYGASSPSP